MSEHTKFEDVMAERFAKLPPSIQRAITSAEVETHLRTLSDTHQLHLDQWSLLENEVMLTLLGMEQTSKLKENIMREVGVSEDVANVLATDITQHVFQPIREELERQLEHPDAQITKVNEMDKVRINALAGEQAPDIPVQQTSAPTASETLATRVEKSTTYTAQSPSHERKSIEGDPYREQIN